MLRPRLVFRDVIENYRLAALPYFVADCCLDFQLTAGLQIKTNLIQHPARNPSLFGDTSNDYKPHPGDAVNNFENGWDGFYTAYLLDILLIFVSHLPAVISGSAAGAWVDCGIIYERLPADIGYCITNL